MGNSLLEITLDEISLEQFNQIELITPREFLDKSSVTKGYYQTTNLSNYPSLEPDPVAYQEYVEWQNEQEEIEEEIVKEQNIHSFRELLNKGLNKLANKAKKKLSKINPFQQGESYEDNRAEQIIKAIKSSKIAPHLLPVMEWKNEIFGNYCVMLT